MDRRHTVRILLIDDHPLVPDSLKPLIESQPDLLIAGEAGTEKQAENLMPGTPAEVALVDVSKPEKGGV